MLLNNMFLVPIVVSVLSRCAEKNSVRERQRGRFDVSLFLPYILPYRCIGTALSDMRHVELGAMLSEMSHVKLGTRLSEMRHVKLRTGLSDMS